MKKYREFINRINLKREKLEQLNSISIYLVDFKGREFELAYDGTKFSQDEIEMIVEDFDLIADTHNLSLFQEEGIDLDYYIEDHTNEQKYEYAIWTNYLDIYLTLSESIVEDILPDIKSFLNGIKYKSTISQYGQWPHGQNEGRLEFKITIHSK